MKDERRPQVQHADTLSCKPVGRFDDTSKKYAFTTILIFNQATSIANKFVLDPL